MKKARMLASGLAVLTVFNAGCMKPFQKDSNSAAMPQKEDAATRPETMVALGDARFEAANMPNRPSNQRDSLLAQALDAYQRALDHDPNHVPALIGMGAVYTGMHDKDKAVASYQRAIKIQPRNAELWFELGRCQGRFKDWNAAVAAMQQAAQFEPDNMKYRKMLGLTLARAGRFDEGYTWLARAMSEADARYVLGRMMQHMNQESASREQMALAIAADPNYKPAKDFLEEMMGNLDAPAAAPAVRAGYQN